MVVDDFTRECLALTVDTSISGARVCCEFGKIAELRPTLHDRQRIGTELALSAVLAKRDAWLHCGRVRIAVIPGGLIGPERIAAVDDLPATAGLGACSLQSRRGGSRERAGAGCGGRLA